MQQGTACAGVELMKPMGKYAWERSPLLAAKRRWHHVRGRRGRESILHNVYTNSLLQKRAGSVREGAMAVLLLLLAVTRGDGGRAALSRVDMTAEAVAQLVARAPRSDRTDDVWVAETF